MQRSTQGVNETDWFLLTGCHETNVAMLEPDVT